MLSCNAPRDLLGLLERNEIAACKNNMNTWAFVGDINDRPQLSCVYKSQDAQNEFLSNPNIGLGEDIYDNDTPKSLLETTSTSTTSQTGVGSNSNAKRVKQ